MARSRSTPTTANRLQRKGFLDLRAEVRVKIYKFAPIPPPKALVPCVFGSCGPDYPQLSKTHSNQETAVQTVGCCSECASPDNGAITSLLRVNKQVFQEATAVLYSTLQTMQKQRPASSGNFWHVPAHSQPGMLQALRLLPYALSQVRTLTESSLSSWCLQWSCSCQTI